MKIDRIHAELAKSGYQPRDIEMAVVDGHRAGRSIGGGVV